MTREEAEKIIKILRWVFYRIMFADSDNPYCTPPTEEEIKWAGSVAIEALEQEPNRDMEEISEIMKSDADAETKCKMISNILTAKPHYFKDQKPTSPCDLCQFNPPSSADGKPCTMCPAEKGGE